MTNLRVNLSEEWFISIDIIATDDQSVPVWIISRSEKNVCRSFKIIVVGCQNDALKSISDWLCF